MSAGSASRPVISDDSWPRSGSAFLVTTTPGRLRRDELARRRVIDAGHDDDRGRTNGDQIDGADHERRPLEHQQRLRPAHPRRSAAGEHGGTESHAGQSTPGSARDPRATCITVTIDHVSTIFHRTRVSAGLVGARLSLPWDEPGDPDDVDDDPDEDEGNDEEDEGENEEEEGTWRVRAAAPGLA